MKELRELVTRARAALDDANAPTHCACDTEFLIRLNVIAPRVGTHEEATGAGPTVWCELGCGNCGHRLHYDAATLLGAG